MPILKIVFVSSDGTGLMALVRSTSKLSRAKFVDIGDLSTQQAIEFVKSKCEGKVAEAGSDEVERFIREVSGGRFALLIKLCEEINEGRPISGNLHGVSPPSVFILYFILFCIFYRASNDIAT